VIALAVAGATVVGVPTAADAAPKHQPKPIAVQLIAMNDFHGRIANTTGADSQQVTAPGPDRAYGTSDDIVSIVGGAANVAATVQQLQKSFRAKNGRTAGSWFVGAGDLISASPFESSVFKDEPTIEVLDAMGLDASSVGNHEFDRGTEELRRISGATDGTFTDDVTACEGVTRGVDGCFGHGRHAFDGADFPYLAANVVSKKSGKPMLPPYQVFTVSGGKKVALIGVVTETTPGIVTPSGVADVKFLDEADAVNTYVPELKRRGVEAIGVLVHEGGTQTGPTAANPNGCDTLTGPIVDINNRIDGEVDLIVSAHTHNAYDCLLPVPGAEKRLVTSAGFYGRLVSDIRLTLDSRTGEVDRKATYGATNVPVTRTAADRRVQSIIDYWTARSADARNRVVGTAAGDLLRGRNTATPPAVVRDRESSLGNFTAQTQLAALQADASFGSPVVAFMNPGGLRADILAGEVTYGEVFEVQPFGNTVGATTLTGAEIKTVLEQQFPVPGRTTTLWLGTSDGFAYNYDPARAANDRIDPCSITLKGTRILPGTDYRVVANSFLLGGGDSFSFNVGDNPVSGPLDVETAVSYFQANSPVAPPAANHATATTQRLSC
jgi:5'-nucleotidase